MLYKKSDHTHIIVMISALGTRIRNRYMDRGAKTKITANNFQRK